MEALKQQTAGCDFVRFTFADIHGIARGRCVSRPSVSQFIEDGVGVYAGCIAYGPSGQIVSLERAIADCRNVTSVVMPGTFHNLPWAGAAKYKIGEVLCENRWSEDEPQGACPRYVARRQLQRLADHGCTLCSGWEEEFFLLHQDTQKPIFDGYNYMCNLHLSEQEEFYLDLQTFLQTAGVEMEMLSNEYAPGQMELTTRPVKDIAGVDMAFILKQGVKEISAQRGLQAVFMSKPFPEFSGSGLHYNFSFTDQSDHSILSDPESDDKLSEFAHHFLGGLIKHGKAICALCCPTVNCYRRLFQPWAPSKITWGLDNRYAFIRVKFGRLGPYFENRLPSAAVNPYLVVAATLAAGFHGVSQKIQPPSAMDDSAREFPRSLQVALQALEEDKVLTEALGEEFVDWFITAKRTVEIEHLKDCDLQDNKPEALQKERDMYFKFI